MFCINCGTEIDDDSIFCPFCGQLTDSPEAEALGQTPESAPTTVIGTHQGPAQGPAQGQTQPIPPSVIPPTTPYGGAQGMPPTQPTPPMSAPYEAVPPRTTQQRRGSSRGAITALVVVLVLAALGVGGFFGARALGLFGSNDQPSASSHSHSHSRDDDDEGSDAADADGEDDEGETAEVDEIIVVPDVVGMSQSDAMRALNEAGLGVGEITYAESSDRPMGEVVAQSPEAASELPEGMTVNLTLSPGPAATPHTYTVVTQAMTWQEANSYCSSHGGHLVTITSAEEYQEVLDAISGYSQQVFWIGYYRMGTDGSFGWVTGETSSYTAWAPGEPNDDEGIEDYAAIFSLSDGSVGWYDVPNDLSDYYRDTKLAFVMETE